MRTLKMIAVTALMLLGPSATGQPQVYTAGELNGTYWRMMTPASRDAFVGGFTTAVRVSLSNEDRRRYIGPGTVGDRVRQIDNFYSNPGAREMPIWIAMMASKLMASGMTDAQAFEEMEKLGVWQQVIPAKN